MRQNKVGVQNLYRVFGHFSLVILCSVSFVHAQSFKDFKTSQAKSFQEYRDERDAAFNKYLKEQWKAYEMYKSKALYEKPKPKSITPTRAKKVQKVGPEVVIDIKPVKKPESKKAEPEEKTVKKDVKEPVIVEQKPKEVVQKPAKKEKPTEIATKPDVKKEDEKPKFIIYEDEIKEDIKPKEVVKKDVNIDFFGSKLGFDIDNDLKRANFYPKSQKGIANFFEKAASSDYDNLIESIKNIQDDLNLNDWGVYLLVRKVSDNIFYDADNSKLLSWFIFNKLGYAVKVGLAKKHVVLMHYSKKIIYSTPNYIFGKKRYYVVANYAKGGVGRLYSYRQDYPDATKSMDLALNSLPKFEENIKNRTLSFERFSKKYSVSFDYNQNLIDFMATYPQANYETFFNAPIQSDTYRQIAQGLKKYIDGKRASEAMNFVLHFVQSSFVYQRDPEQFGREKVMFAEETLYFKKSDCEDRAILYAYLIKKLFGIGVVGVKYKDHMSTALYVPLKGDSVRTGSKRFVMADPTYINANIGQNMPKYRNIRPESFVYLRAN